MVNVISIRSARAGWQNSAEFVYIGRAGHGLSGLFGNPIELKPGMERGSTIERFAEYFHSRLEEDEAFRSAVESIPSTASLVCFCKPQACHGDVIADYLNRRTTPTTSNKKVLAVVGSRTFSNQKQMMDAIVAEHPNEIVSGGARGADSMAKYIAAYLDIPIREFLPDWDRFGRSAGFKRNAQIIAAATHVIAFYGPDGVTAGTKNSVDLARSAHKPVKTYFQSKEI